jgi:LPS O-antigen subunit length determinant protein (WzzB/FepE family)
VNQNLDTFSNPENEIDLKKLFKLLFDSKKLIIVTTIFTTLLALLLITQQKPVYTSAAIIEVGDYHSSSLKTKIIEPLNELIDDLEINFIIKQNITNLRLKAIASRLIEIKYTYPLIENNNELVDKLVKYLKIKHSKILITKTKEVEDQLIDEIELIEAQIEFANSVFLSQNADKKLDVSNHVERINSQIEFEKVNEKLRISNRIDTISDRLPTLSEKIKAVKKVIIEDESNLKLLASKPDLLIQRASESPTLNQIIYSYSVELLNFEAEMDSLLKEKDYLQGQLKALENGNLESEQIFNLYQIKENLQGQLKALENGNLESEKIFNLYRQLNRLKFELESLMNQNPSKTKLVREIETRTIDSKKLYFLILGFFSGLFLSVVTVLIINAFKEEQV